MILSKLKKLCAPVKQSVWVFFLLLLSPYHHWHLPCSSPPTYISTGINLSAFSLANGSFSLCASVYLKKYQAESTKVSMVSVSLLASPLHWGHLTFSHSLASRSGDNPFPETDFSFGRMTGRSLSGTGTACVDLKIGRNINSGVHFSVFFFFFVLFCFVLFFAFVLFIYFLFIFYFYFLFFYFFLFLILPGCSFRCNHLFSHKAQDQNVPNSLTVGMGFHCSYVPSIT